MSARSVKARSKAGVEEHALSPLEDGYLYNGEEKSALTPAEKKRLNFLGYKSNDITELSVDDARRVIDAKQRRAGSVAAMKAIEKQIGVPNPAISAFSDPAIEKRNAGKEQTFIVQDEWEGKGLRAAGLLFDETDKPYRDANPGHVFRWLHANVCDKLGTDGFQEVRGPDGARVTCADHWLAFKPREVQERQDRELEEQVNAPFKDIGEPKTVHLGSVVGDRAYETRETTIHRGDEQPRYIGGA